MELIGAGRAADVYALDDRRVLRRYRDGGSAATEAAVMAHARAHGVPVPAVHDVTGPDLVLDRLTGPMLLQAALDGDRTADDVARLLAGLHHRLHAVPPSGHPRPVAPEDGAAPATVVHLDLHPGNVVLTASGPVLIDWRNATDGPGDLDIAYTALILAQVAVDPGAGPPALAAALIEPFLTAAAGAPLRHLETATARRGADPMMSATELDRLGAAAALVARTAR